MQNQTAAEKKFRFFSHFEFESERYFAISVKCVKSPYGWLPSLILLAICQFHALCIPSARVVACANLVLPSEILKMNARAGRNERSGGWFQ